LLFAKRFALIALAALGTVSAPAAAWAQYQPVEGRYPVITVARVVLHDSQRHKDVPVKIYYPDGKGPFPVIIFSHGALASKDDYSGLGKYWASHGYVSIHPSHADSIADSGFPGTLLEAIHDPRAWENRPRDISFVIDSLVELQERVPGLKGKLDRARIGVGGHSFGAFTAQAIGGATVWLPGNRRALCFYDKRVKAVVMLSPQGEGEMGLTAHSWDKFRVPMLLMVGSKDFGPEQQAPSWRAAPFQRAPAGDKYEVELAGATHMIFAERSVPAGALSHGFQCARIQTTAFWDAYLKGNAQAKEYLKTNGLQAFSANAATFAQK
jgi:predicted dienelactone hydrolase